jgi:hypothetical protein
MWEDYKNELENLVEETVLDGIRMLIDFRFDCNNIGAVMYTRIVLPYLQSNFFFMNYGELASW